ncbi:sensor histidine kinase [Spirosoma flavum]|uniref:histidine kinase n=1 Tax=Spirosoma flavum TaxID=2048557 RepID=A0ABW6ASH5_9BACT
MQTQPLLPLQILVGEGEMGDLTRAFDWANSPVGPIESWPQSLRTIVSMILSSKFPMFLWWGDDLIQFYNDAYRPSLGNHGKHPNALGQRGEECWPEIWPTIKPLIDQVLAGGEATWSENQLIPIYRNGRLEDVYWTFSYTPVLNELNQVSGVLVVCQETTGMVTREESRQQLLASFEQSPVAIAIISEANLTIRMANPFYGQLVGRPFNDLIGKPLLDVLPELRGQGFDQLLKEVIATGVPYIAPEVAVQILRENKLETIYIDLTYQPQREADGSISGVLVVATDVTKQVTARQKVEESEARYRALSADLDEKVQERTQQLQASIQDLQRSNQNLQQFAYIASHDLQEPLRKIQQFGDLLKDRFITELGEGIDYLDRMQLAAVRMSTLIRDLLAFSRVSISQNKAVSVSLTGVVNVVLSDLDIRIEETGALLTVDPLPTIIGDPSQLEQLFQNLLSNALKFRQMNQAGALANPVILVSNQRVAAVDLPTSIIPSRIVKAYHRIDVTDNGIGFDDKYVDRIFQVFQRLHGKNEFAGTGIGLAICEKIVANHGGAITARSQPNKGATFSIYFPATNR